MLPEERTLLEGLFERIRNNSQTPRDLQAEAFVAEAVRQQPYATYFLAQTVILQDQALQVAIRRTQDLEAQVKAVPGTEAPGSFLGNFGKSWFSGTAPAGTPRPQPFISLPPQPASPSIAAVAPVQSGGFLQQALGAATGVAGGMLLAESVRSLLGGHGFHSAGGGFASTGANDLHAQDVVQDQEQDEGESRNVSDVSSYDGSWEA